MYVFIYINILNNNNNNNIYYSFICISLHFILISWNILNAL